MVISRGIVHRACSSNVVRLLSFTGLHAVNVKSVRIVDVRPADDESEEGTVNYSDTGGSNDGQRATNLISGKWYTARCLAEGASPKATVEWSIDGNGTLADEEIPPSPPTSARMTVVEVSYTRPNLVTLPGGRGKDENAN